MGDPALAEFLGLAGSTVAGVSVSERNAMTLSAVFRSVALISGTIAGLPLRTFRRITLDNGQTRKERVASWVDDPGLDLTPFEFVELSVAHLALWGNVYWKHVHGGAGQVMGLQPVIPSAVSVEADREHGKLFKVQSIDGQQTFTPLDLTHCMGLGTDGLKGLSVIGMARQSLGTSMAGDQAAAKMFANGLLMGGVLTAKEDLTTEQADQIRAGLRAKAQGSRNAGDVAFVPANIEFSPWTMNAEDAQFLQSRHFGIEEVARWYGVPRELLSESGASSWGSGIQELVRAFQKFTLSGYTSRIEARLSRLLPRPQFVEFDFAGLLAGSPETEIALLLQQVEGGLLTVDEARAIRNLPPLPVRPVKLEEVA